MQWTGERLGREQVEAYHQAVLSVDQAQHVAWFRQQGEARCLLSYCRTVSQSRRGGSEAGRKTRW